MNKLGINTVKTELTNIEDYSVVIYKECLTELKESGFNYIEFSHVHHLTPEEMAEIGDFGRTLELMPYSVHNEGSILKYGEETYFKIQEKCLRNAKAMGGKLIVFHLPYPLGKLDENIEPVKRLVDLADKYQITPALENGPIEIILEIIEKVDSPDLGFILDTGHAFRDGYNIPEWIHNAGDRLIHTHLADNFGMSDDHLPPGMGLIQWADVFNALREIHYNGVLLVELTGVNVKRKRSIEYLRTFPLEPEIEIACHAVKQLLKNSLRCN